MNIEGFTRQELLTLSWEKPMMGQLEITRDCNQKCIFCYKACCPEKDCFVLTTEQWESIILKLKKLGVKRLHFSGGESFIHPGFAELVAFGKSHGFEVWMTTNGSYDCKEVAKNADRIIFSIHGMEKTHDAITQKNGSFALARKHIIEASSLVQVSINMVLVKLNYPEIIQVFEYFDQLCGLTIFYSTLPIKSIFGFQFEETSLELTPELIDDYKAKLAKIPKHKLELKHGFQNIYVNDPAFYTSQTIPLANCAAGKYKIVIDFNGDVYPCNFFRGPEFLCGNILDGDVHEIWRNGKGFNRFREINLQEWVPEKCHHCIKKYKCLGGCMAWTKDYKKGVFKNDADCRCEIGNAFIGS